MTLIGNNYSKLTRIVSHIQNPNYVAGTLIEEIPTDIGRSYAGYKRGGVIEFLEKMRKELMSAAVWMAGIPLFNKLGNYICEKRYNLPTGIDFSRAKEGNDAIENSINFLKTGKLGDFDVSNVMKYGDKYLPKKPKFIKKLFKKPIIQKELDIEGLNDVEKTFLTKGKLGDIDVSDLMKYGEKYKGYTSDQIKSLIKKVSTSKQITSIAAIGLNCLAMGVIITKINQALTARALKKQNLKKEKIDQFKPKVDSFSQFALNTKKQISFKGKMDDFAKNYLAPSGMTYQAENNNRYRLLITDIPMVIGRCLTSRNKYEAIEFAFMDLASAVFYNFTTSWTQQGIRHFTKVPSIDPKIAELLVQDGNLDATKEAIKTVSQNSSASLESLYDKVLVNEIYSLATHGKYNKINKFVKNSDIKDTNEGVINFLKYIGNKTKDVNETGTAIKNAVKKINKSNALYLAGGLGVSILGLSVIVPKLTYFISQKLTGKNEFVAIDTSLSDKKDKNVTKS